MGLHLTQICSVTIVNLRRLSITLVHHCIRNYHATPYVTTGKCPADLLFQSRTYRVRLPELSKFQNDDREIREGDAKKKSQTKRYADRSATLKHLAFE